jgi:hypothetical protein
MNPARSPLARADAHREGEEWEPWAGLGGNRAEAARAQVERSRIAREKRARPWKVADVPAIVRRPAANNRPKLRSVKSSMSSPRRAVRWRTASSPLRPT